MSRSNQKIRAATLCAETTGRVLILIEPRPLTLALNVWQFELAWLDHVQ